ncbi:polycystin-1-like protein 3 [Ptychodera flava]|uniref:polycystin-1-like protein 3 n=1 Tax=Ptychodera flava TaxID=63121 RepID=UPI003969D49C
MIASDFPSHQEDTLIESLYFEESNVTYYGMVLKVSYLHHAILIVFNPEITGPLYGNTTAYIFNDVVKYSDRYHGYQFSLDVHFSGNYSNIFIPEDNFRTTGQYYLTFTIPGRQEGNISVAIKETVCNYMDKQTTIWDSNGCKVSPVSNMTTTICLCKHLKE